MSELEQWLYVETEEHRQTLYLSEKLENSGAVQTPAVVKLGT